MPTVMFSRHPDLDAFLTQQTCPSTLYANLLHRAINILAVKAYGEAEFWLSGGKVILIFSLFFFTFITMVGGNPEGDVSWLHM